MRLLIDRSQATPLGFGLLGLQGLSELVKRIAALRGAIALDTTYHKPDQ